MEVREVLEGALAFFDNHDWIKDDLVRYRDGTVGGADGEGIERPLQEVSGGCLEGACYYVTDDALKAVAAARVLGVIARGLFPDRFVNGRAVFNFNDHQDTTREDMLLVVKHAIESA